MEKPTIKVIFRWDSLQPDRRQWKPSNPLIEPLDVMIALDVPLTKEYIYNSEQIIQSQLANGTVPEPILTIKGMRYCIDQFENEMSDKAESKVTAEDNEEWETIDSPDNLDEWK